MQTNFFIFFKIIKMQQILLKTTFNDIIYMFVQLLHNKNYVIQLSGKIF